MLRVLSSSRMEKKEQRNDFQLADGKFQNEGEKWRAWASRPKSLLLFFVFIICGFLLCGNIFLDPYASMFWTSQVPPVVIHSNINCQYARVDGKCSKSEGVSGKDLLPRGIIQSTSNLEVQPLGKNSISKENLETRKNLLAIAAGIKQKSYVNRIVQKFLPENFTIMLFHYDGAVDKWHDLEWSAEALHIVAINQTKWWFAKRFMHPDVVAPYDYIFIWDEDLGVQNFRVDSYLKIMKEEGLEIAQPALDQTLSEVHHKITIRNKKTRLHRRTFKTKGTGILCFANSTDPPCTGWIEGMAPVFSRDAWRCVWHLIQNDLVHGWGMDLKLGYCTKGDRARKIGVIDSEYIVHRGIPSLGGRSVDKNLNLPQPLQLSYVKSFIERDSLGSKNDARSEVRRRSYAELDIFSQRWQNAVEEDECWHDRYQHRVTRSSSPPSPPSSSRSSPSPPSSPTTSRRHGKGRTKFIRTSPQ